ncbi:MAG: methionine--tRNA ligase [Spirochaetales bacterium]|nr:methionine--tRNA ligase [Spirochaetales bacterium]
MSNKRLITSALPYVNNIPHLGNIIGCVLSADVFARYCRMEGYETLYVCGNDEYGTTTETRALQEHVTPKQLCDKYHAIHKEIYDWFNIQFDAFGRTSTPEQTKVVQEIFRDLYNNGYITEGTVTQPFCEKCNMPLADRYVDGTCPHCGYEQAKGDQCDKCGKLLDPAELKNPRCTVCGSKPVFRQSRHLFLDLQKVAPQLTKWIDETAEKNGWSNNAVSVAKGWIEQGLQKRCITRDLKWGVPVPLAGYEDKVFYVWFDAPIGYISITAAAGFDIDKWWHDPDHTDLYQFIGKDNIPFHTVIFPSSLMGTGKPWTLLKTISSTEYLNYEDKKFSKSRGTGVFGDQARDTGIDADLFRYYLIRNRPEKSDTQFFWNDFMEKANGEIIANFANLVNRVYQFINRFFDGVIPDFDNASPNSIFSIIDMQKEKQTIIADFEAVELKKALLDVLAICSAGNKFFQDNAPWAVIKEDKAKAATMLGSLACFTKDIALLLYPFIPATVEKVFATLNLPKTDIVLDNIGDYTKLKGKKINEPQILFAKLDKKQVEALQAKFAGSQETAADNTEDLEAFAKLQLKVGRIIEINRHPEADKLYVEKIDLGGGDIRQIVSGLVPYYAAEQLLGQNVIVVANLKPANLRGVESFGMILAAEDKKKTTVEVLFCPKANIGDIVTIDAVNAAPANEITIDDFAKVKLTVKDNHVLAQGQQMKLGGSDIITQNVVNGKVR